MWALSYICVAAGVLCIDFLVPRSQCPSQYNFESALLAAKRDLRLTWYMVQAGIMAVPLFILLQVASSTTYICVFLWVSLRCFGNVVQVWIYSLLTHGLCSSTVFILGTISNASILLESFVPFMFMVRSVKVLQNLLMQDVGLRRSYLDSALVFLIRAFTWWKLNHRSL